MRQNVMFPSVPGIFFLRILGNGHVNTTSQSKTSSPHVTNALSLSSVILTFLNLRHKS